MSIHNGNFWFFAVFPAKSTRKFTAIRVEFQINRNLLPARNSMVRLLHAAQIIYLALWSTCEWSVLMNAKLVLELSLAKWNVRWGVKFERLYRKEDWHKVDNAIWFARWGKRLAFAIMDGILRAFLSMLMMGRLNLLWFSFIGYLVIFLLIIGLSIE